MVLRGSLPLHFPVAAIVATIAIPFASAQTQAINGSIRGRVTDPAGAAVPGATVSVDNVATNYSREVTSNEEGYFVIPNLPIGTYTVSVKKEGFEAQRHPGIVLDAGTEAVIDARSRWARSPTTVEVTGGAPVIEPSRVSTGRTIDAGGGQPAAHLPQPVQFRDLPTRRERASESRVGHPSRGEHQRARQPHQYQMDGMVDTESDRYGLRLFAISDIYVREVQTVSNSFAPEFGRTAGDIYNVITNSGYQRFSWRVLFYRPAAGQRPPHPAGGQPDQYEHRSPRFRGQRRRADHQRQAIHFRRLRAPAARHADAGHHHIRQRRGHRASRIAACHRRHRAARPVSEPARGLEHQPKNQFFARYNYFRNEYPFNTQNGGLNALSAASDFHDRAHIGGFQLLTTFSPTVLNELRASEPYRNEHHVADPLTGPGPAITITGIANFNGTTAPGPLRREDPQPQR